MSGVLTKVDDSSTPMGGDGGSPNNQGFILFVQSEEADNPPSGYVTLYQLDGYLWIKDSSGTALRVQNRINSGLLEDIPTAGFSGRLYFATDASGGAFYFDNGSTWEEITIAPALHSDTHGEGEADEITITKSQISDLGAIREVLTTDRTYYISTSGSDANDGLTSETAIKTPQVAVNKALLGIDAAGHNVTLQFADGEQTSGINIWGPGVGINHLYLTGNVSSVASCKITTAESCIVVNAPLDVTIAGFQLKATGYSSEVYAAKSARVTLGVMKYDTSGYAHINANWGGAITLSGNYEVIGGAVAHIHCDTGGEIYGGSVTATFTGTPNFSAFTIGVSFGNVYVANMTWSGAVTGQRYFVHSNGCIYGTSSLTFIPGDSGGVEASGGKYLGDDTYPDALQVSPTWSTPTLINSWVNLAGSFNDAGYYLDQFGIVHLRGMISTGSIGTTAFVLPAGYRPANPTYLSTVSADLFGAVKVETDGSVKPYVGSSSWVSLDGISFAL